MSDVLVANSVLFSVPSAVDDAGATATANPASEYQTATPEVNGHFDKQTPVPTINENHDESKPTNGSSDVPAQQQASSPVPAKEKPSPVVAQEPATGDQSTVSALDKATEEPTGKSESVDNGGDTVVDKSVEVSTSIVADTPVQSTAESVVTTEVKDVEMEEVPAAPVNNEPVKTESNPAVDEQQPDVPAGGQNANGTAPPPAVPQSSEVGMQDVPPASSSPKVAREREEDAGNNEQPAPKRTKIEDEASVGVAPEVKAEEKLEGKSEDKPKAPETQSEQKPESIAAVPPASVTASADSITKMQHKFLLKSMQSLKRMQDSRFYREPVDPVKLMIPQYSDIVKQPMDLGTIERKLRSDEYKIVQDVVDDMNLMVNNAVLFNGPQHIVAQEGVKLKGTFEKQMTHLPKPDAVEEKKPKKIRETRPASRRESRSAQQANNAQQAAQAAADSATAPTATTTAATTGASPQNTTFALGPEGLPLIRRDSTTADGRPKRSIHPPKRDLPYSTKPKKKKYQWELKFCQESLDELYKPKHYSFAAPFYYPVDPVALNIPTYHSIIKKPMDLSTIQSKLKTGQYENAKEFEADMRLMFKNCYKFNLIGDPTYVAGQQLEELFDRKWSQKGRYLEAHEPHTGPQANSSDEESEEPDSDSDQKVVALLQKQIAEMSRQVDAIQKKKTPPSSKKASKSKKKDSGKSGGKEKKAKSKPEKPRWVTYQEKQQISNGISSLPDKKMQEALKIIQNNVPALKVNFLSFFLPLLFNGN